MAATKPPTHDLHFLEMFISRFFFFSKDCYKINIYALTHMFLSTGKKKMCPLLGELEKYKIKTF